MMPIRLRRLITGLRGQRFGPVREGAPSGRAHPVPRKLRGYRAAVNGPGRAAGESGRDPASIPRAASLSLSEPWDHVRRTIDTLAEAGADCLIVSWPSEGRGRLEEFVSDVIRDHRN